MPHLTLSPNHAIDFGTMAALESVLDAHDPDSVFVLRGAGPHFALGGDLKAFAGLLTRDEGLAMARRMNAILERIERLPRAAVAGVNGAAYGGGVELLGAFDHIVAVPEAVFGFTQGRFALPPGWGGRTRLSHRVGGILIDGWLTTQAVIDAPTALESGLIDEIVPAESLSRRLKALTGQPPRKRSVPLERAGAIEAELDQFADAWASEEHHRRVAAFLNRVRP